MFPPPMTVFTIKHDGTNLKQRTFDQDMNWAPYPAPDGRHYVFVRVVDGRNWEIFLGDLEGGAPVRLTWYDGWDGLPSLSPNGQEDGVRAGGAQQGRHLAERHGRVVAEPRAGKLQGRQLAPRWRS